MLILPCLPEGVRLGILCMWYIWATQKLTESGWDLGGGIDDFVKAVPWLWALGELAKAEAVWKPPGAVRSCPSSQSAPGAEDLPTGMVPSGSQDLTPRGRLLVLTDLGSVPLRWVPSSGVTRL